MTTPVRDLKEQNDNMLAAIRFLRETIKDILKEHEHKRELPSDCHCVFCVAEYAMAVTSGYAEEEKE